MICKKCGKEFEDDNIFCPYCGIRTDVVDEQVNYMEDNTVTETDTTGKIENLDEEKKEPTDKKLSKKSNKTKIILIIVAIVVILAGVGGYLGYRSVSKPTVVDLTSVMTMPEFKGVDGVAKMKTDVVVDEKKADKLVKSIDKEDRAKAVKKLLESVTYSSNQTENLSNGDEVVITAHYDATFAKENKIEIGRTQKKVKVENLAVEVTVEDIRNSGIIDKMKKDGYISGGDDVIYRWLYCKSSAGSIIVAISYYDGIDYSGLTDENGNFEEEIPVRYWYINNTNTFTKTLDNVHIETWEIFGQSIKESYDECINVIKAEGFSIEIIQ